MPYNPDCPACREKRCHTAEEWRMHYGHGTQGNDRRYIQPKQEPETSEPQTEAEPTR